MSSEPANLGPSITQGRPEAIAAKAPGRLGWRWVGRALIATGVLHVVVGVAGFWEVLGRMVGAGLINLDVNELAYGAAFWFLFGGLMIIFLGLLVHHLNITLGRPAPRWLGWCFVVTAAVCLPMMPASGFWLIGLLGVWIIVSAGRARSVPIAA